MLCIGEEDINKAVTPAEIIEAVESAFRLYETNHFKMPDRMHIDHEGNTLLLMPAISGESYATKLVSVFPENVEKSLPVVMGTVLLNDSLTGEPLALLNGSTVTALRTGAVGAVGIRYITPETCSRVGIVGTGVQGFNQAFFASFVRNLSHIYVYGRSPRKTETLVMKLKQALTEQKASNMNSTTVQPVNSPEELLKDSQAVITATASPGPVLPDDGNLLKGKHFVGIGSFRPTMREFPRSLFTRLKEVYVDTHHAKAESGDLAVPLKEGWIDDKQVFTLGRKITEGRGVSPGETTLFKSVGMALFDLTVSDLIYRRSRAKGLGTEIKL
jgi:ornithine cyclodeaminase